MKRKDCFLAALLLTAPTLFASTSPAPESAPLKQEQISALLREKLTPFVESTLQEHCGEDCPSFRIDPQFKKVAMEGSLEDLGFSKPSQPEGTPELQSVSISVLIQDQVPQKARESLRKILSHRITNEANVPVVVRMMGLNAFAPLMERRQHTEEASFSSSEKLSLVQALAWPASLLLFGAILLFALHRVLKHRKELFLKRLASQKPVEKPPVFEQKGTLAFELLESRIEDLSWLIEDATLRSDAAAIQKIVSLFPAQELTSRARLSREALQALALASESAKKIDQKLAFDWIVPALDEAHWKLMEEKAEPLSRVRRYPSNRAVRIFSELSSPSLKALFITALPDERWPELLATLKSEERVQLGLTLADVAACAPDVRAALSSQLSQELTRKDDALQARSEEALESFALYLSEKEGQKLWQELSVRSLAPHSAPRSIEEILSKLDASTAAEVCTRLDITTLSVALSQVSEETRARIHRHLPKALQARLSSNTGVSQKPTEVAQMKARAAILGAYRSGSWMQ